MARDISGPSLVGDFGGGGGTESFSYRGSELTKAERARIAAQNKAAESAKSKNLDAVDRGKAAADTRERGIQQREEYAHNVGLAKGAAVGAAAGAVAQYVVSKGTQANHAVTDNNNHTKVIPHVQSGK